MVPISHMSSTIPNTFMLSHINIDISKSEPLYRQIYNGIRQAILNRQLIAGMRLPSSRELAELTGVSRNTILNAFDQLIAEGYLETRLGAGTYVTANIQDTFHIAPEKPPTVIKKQTPRLLSPRGQAYDRVAKSLSFTNIRNKDNLFKIGVPDLNEVPFDLWAKITNKQIRHLPLANFEDQHPAGYLPLRQAISDYLKSSRAVNCSPEQIIIVSGSQQALYIASMILADSEDTIWMENPGYDGAYGILQNTGGHIIPVPVDDDGLNVEIGEKIAPNARLIYTTPSHQFPLGVTMSLKRRFELLNFAESSSAWILEDDYDSEYRYEGHPLASLQGLDTSNRVIYIGTFSKVLFSGLRLGYAVVPPDLIDAFIIGRSIIDRYPPIIPQATLAEFIKDGHFIRHLRRMRKLYSKKKIMLENALNDYLPNEIEVQASAGGMHIVGWLKGDIQSYEVAKYARKRNLFVQRVSNYEDNESTNRQGIVLGYTGTNITKIREGVLQLMAIFRQIEKDQASDKKPHA